MANNTPSTLDLLDNLEHDPSWRRQAVAGGQLDPQLAMLRAWQSQRLARTYADFVADRACRPACEFMMSDVYAPRDFSQRDHDLDRMYAILSRFFPDHMLELLVDTIELKQLSYTLDNALLRALLDVLGLAGPITPELYAQGYRVCDNYDERARQIELLVKIMRTVDEGARWPGVSLALRLAKGPARRAGWGESYDFVERGYAALKRMRSAEPLVCAIERREMRILDQIFAGQPDPFDVSGEHGGI